MCDLQAKIGIVQLTALTQSDPGDKDNYLITYQLALFGKYKAGDKKDIQFTKAEKGRPRMTGVIHLVIKHISAVELVKTFSCGRLSV